MGDPPGGRSTTARSPPPPPSLPLLCPTPRPAHLAHHPYGHFIPHPAPKSLASFTTLAVHQPWKGTSNPSRVCAGVYPRVSGVWSSPGSAAAPDLSGWTGSFTCGGHLAIVPQSSGLGGRTRAGAAAGASEDSAASEPAPSRCCVHVFLIRSPPLMVLEMLKLTTAPLIRPSLPQCSLHCWGRRGETQENNASWRCWNSRRPRR